MTLTEVQEKVLAVIKKAGGPGQITTDDVSRITNYSMFATERAIEALRASGHI